MRESQQKQKQGGKTEGGGGGIGGGGGVELPAVLRQMLGSGAKAGKQ